MDFPDFQPSLRDLPKKADDLERCEDWEAGLKAESSSLANFVSNVEVVSMDVEVASVVEVEATKPEAEPSVDSAELAKITAAFDKAWKRGVLFTRAIVDVGTDEHARKRARTNGSA